ncbi:MAG: hypothetical protein ACUVR8_03495 [Acidobacteriota bacterium]
MRKALEQAAQLTVYRDMVSALRREGAGLVLLFDGEPRNTETVEHRWNLGRPRRGLRTPEEAHYLLILRVLHRRGESGQVSDVLEEVREAMKDILRDVDFEPLASNPHSPRRWHAARWEAKLNGQRGSSQQRRSAGRLGDRREGTGRSRKGHLVWSIA